jgi:hypothetical protein
MIFSRLFPRFEAQKAANPHNIQNHRLETKRFEKPPGFDARKSLRLNNL